MSNDLFPVTEGGKKIQLPFIRIKCFYAKRTYTIVDTLDNRQYLKCWYIGKIARFVKHSKLFFKADKSTLVNTVYVNWEQAEYPHCPLIDGNHLKVARRNKNAFKKLLPVTNTG